MFGQAVECVLKARKFNGGLDLYSKGSVSKFELLRALSVEHGLEYSIRPVKDSWATVTGHKPSYFSCVTTFKRYGYDPKKTSLELLLQRAFELTCPPPGSLVHNESLRVWFS